MAEITATTPKDEKAKGAPRRPPTITRDKYEDEEMVTMFPRLRAIHGLASDSNWNQHCPVIGGEVTVQPNGLVTFQTLEGPFRREFVAPVSYCESRADVILAALEPVDGGILPGKARTVLSKDEAEKLADQLPD